MEAEKLYPTCWGCSMVLDGKSFNTEKCEMVIHNPEEEVIEVCVACFEELSGYEQI